MTVSKAKLLHQLDAVQKSSWCRRTLYLSPVWLSAYALNRNRSPANRIDEPLDSIMSEVGGSETGLVVFMGEDEVIAVSPPFPITTDIEASSAATGRLRELMERRLTLGIVLLRLGRYAVGVLENDRLVASKADTRYVKNRHRAGGSSQRRFERSRERLIRELFDKTCEITRNVFSPYEDEIDYVLLGGEKQTLAGFSKRCQYFQNFEQRTLKRRLTVDRPGKAALDNIAFEVWKSRVTVFKQED